MQQTERIKQEIGLYKVTYAILIVTVMSLLSWIAQNFESGKSILLILSSIAIVIVISAVIITYKRIFKFLRQLEE